MVEGTEKHYLFNAGLTKACLLGYTSFHHFDGLAKLKTTDFGYRCGKIDFIHKPN